MIDILRNEFFRLKKSKTFWIMIGVLALLPLLGWAFTSIILAGLLVTTGGMLGTVDISQITVSSLSEMANIGTLPDLLGLICAAVFLSKEFTDGTIRNAILAAKSRSQIYFSYLIVALTIGLSMKVSYFLSTLVVYGSTFGFKTLSPFDATMACITSFMLTILCTLFVQTCTTMFLFVGKKQSTALIYPILITTFATGIIQALASVVDMIAGINGTYSEEWKTWIPLLNLSYFDAGAVDARLFFKGAMYLALFTALFVFVGRNAFAKADLK